MNTPDKQLPLLQRHYFIDEAGDSTLFNRYGKMIVGTEGCSRFFILGLLDIPSPDVLAGQLNILRHQILADPYFRGVPSCDPKNKKTALAFHAKDDLPEIRREVFRFLHNYNNLRFYAIVTDKLCTVKYVRTRNRTDQGYRYHPNELYDSLVRRLCRDRLTDGEQYQVCFAKRGPSDRTAALKAALVAARKKYNQRWEKTGEASFVITAKTPDQNEGLQAVDYFLWSLQRLYEKQEDRYFEYLWPAFRLIIDMDDRRNKAYGEYYTQKKPLTLAALQTRQTIDLSGI